VAQRRPQPDLEPHQPENNQSAARHLVGHGGLAITPAVVRNLDETIRLLRSCPPARRASCARRYARSGVVMRARRCLRNPSLN